MQDDRFDPEENFGEEDSQAAWYKIRDNLTGDNYVEQNIPRAFALASVCQHPEARWLMQVSECRNLSVFSFLFFFLLVFLFTKGVPTAQR